MSITSKICIFVNKLDKPDWWRFVVSKILESGELTRSDLDIAYTLAQMEFGLVPKCVDYATLTKAVKATGFHAEEEENKLLSVGNVSNVSTLAPDKTINFSPSGLTVVYGNNGAGKSSYAKILKKACLTRGDAPPIRGNVFLNQRGTPSAEIKIESNGQAMVIPWSLYDEADPRLKSIRVFDSQSSIHYLTKSDNLDYKPAALKLLDGLILAGNHISETVKNDVKAFSPQNIIPTMTEGTAPSKLRITSKLKPEEVDALCSTPNELKELEELRNELVELANNSPQTLKERYKKRRLRALPLQNFLNDQVSHFGQEQVVKLKFLYDKMQETKRSATKLSSSTFSGLSIPSIGSDAWLTMWDAVKNFVESHETLHSFPPQKGEYCPTCIQKLDDSAASRLASFAQYLRSSLQQEAVNAKHLWIEEVKKLKKVNTSSAPYDAILSEIKLNDETLGKHFDDLLKELQIRARNLTLTDPTFDLAELDITALTTLNEKIVKLEDLEKAVSDDQKMAILIQSKQQRVNEIEDRQKVALVADQIKTEIDKAKKRDIYDKVQRSTSSSSITRLSTEIYSSGAIGKMQEIFNLELDRLGFKHYKLDALTKGAKGNQKFSIQLSNNNTSIIDIASEGEQKCISLASFFAELGTDDRKSAIIFDDPVNSLDHHWRLKFALRIVEESINRQVIVFTHDLPFMKMIQEIEQDTTIRAVDRTPTLTGIPRDTPPWDALKTDKRIKQLKNELVGTRKLAEGLYEDQYKQKASNIYGKMRETWERLIEEWLIRGVVERFNREVKTQNCRYLVDIEASDIDKINSAMYKCSTYMHGHDMSSEISGTFPEIEELQSDLDALESYFVELKKRRT